MSSSVRLMKIPALSPNNNAKNSNFSTIQTELEVQLPTYKLLEPGLIAKWLEPGIVSYHHRVLGAPLDGA